MSTLHRTGRNSDVRNNVLLNKTDVILQDGLFP